MGAGRVSSSQKMVGGSVRTRPLRLRSHYRFRDDDDVTTRSRNANAARVGVPYHYHSCPAADVRKATATSTWLRSACCSAARAYSSVWKMMSGGDSVGVRSRSRFRGRCSMRALVCFQPLTWVVLRRRPVGGCPSRTYDPDF